MTINCLAIAFWPVTSLLSTRHMTWAQIRVQHHPHGIGHNDVALRFIELISVLLGVCSRLRNRIFTSAIFWEGETISWLKIILRMIKLTFRVGSRALRDWTPVSFTFTLNSLHSIINPQYAYYSTDRRYYECNCSVADQINILRQNLAENKFWVDLGKNEAQ
jgi:hypothetical protein